MILRQPVTVSECPLGGQPVMPGSALITGAGDGIGRDLAIRLAKGGWRITVTPGIGTLDASCQLTAHLTALLCCSRLSTFFRKPLRKWSVGRLVCTSGTCAQLDICNDHQASRLFQADEIRAAGGQAQAVCCDVVNASQQAAAFEHHLRAYSTLEVVCLNAGISETGVLLTRQLHM